MCRNCGEENPEGSPYCNSCGSPLAASSATQKVAPPQPTPPHQHANLTQPKTAPANVRSPELPYSPPKNFPTNAHILLIALLVVGVLGSFAISKLGGNEQAKSSASKEPPPSTAIDDLGERANAETHQNVPDSGTNQQPTVDNSKPVEAEKEAPTLPTIEFRWTDKTETPYGTVFRIAYEISGADSATIVDEAGKSGQIHLPSLSTAVYVTEHTVLTIKAKHGDETVSRDLELNPNTELMGENPPDYDQVDLLSYALCQEDLNSLDGDNLSPIQEFFKDVLEESSAEDVQLLVNSMFARHGFKFKKPEVRANFADRSWYVPTIDDEAQVTANFNIQARRNLDFLKAEKQRKQ